MFRGPFATLFLIVFIDLIGFGIIVPLLPLYAETLHASGFEVGLLMASFSLGQFIAAPRLGALSDRYGRRPILIFSLFIGAVAYLIFGLGESLWVLFISRTLAGLCGGNIAAAKAYAADVTSIEDRAKAMGMLGAAFGLGFVLGPAIGGILSNVSPGAPFFAAAGLSAIAGLLTYFKLPEPENRVVRDRGRTSSLGLLRERPLIFVVIVFFATTFAFTHLETTFSLFCAAELHLDPDEVGYLFGYIGILMVIVQGGFIGTVTRRLGVGRTLMVGIALMAIGLPLLALSPSVLLMLVALVPVAVGNGLASPAILTLLSRLAKPERQGETQGLGSSASGLARVLGPISAGALYTSVSHASPFVVGGLIMGLAILIAIPLVGRGEVLPASELAGNGG